MLQNVYLLANVGADTAEPHVAPMFDTILSNLSNVNLTVGVSISVIRLRNLRQNPRRELTSG